MPAFGRTSANNLRTCHPLLRLLFERVVEEWDCSITEGHRGRTAQDRMYLAGASQLQWPKGKHNDYPSRAVDAHPYPRPDWGDHAAFVLFAGRVQGVALMLGIEIRWGGDWDGDSDLSDQTFNDLVHFELIDA